METIKIAPSHDEVIIEGNEVRTDFAGGIVYRAEGLGKFKDEYIKASFCTAIALASKKWQLEDILNSHFCLNGEIL